MRIGDPIKIGVLNRECGEVKGLYYFVADDFTTIDLLFS